MPTIGCDGGDYVIYGGLESPTVVELHGRFRWFSVDVSCVGRGDEAAESGEQRLCGECLSRVHSCHENGVKQGGEEA